MDFEEGFGELQKTLLRADPLSLLATMGLSSVLTQMKTEDELKPDEFLMAHYELIHALLLKSPFEGYAGSLVDGPEIQRIYTLSGQVSTAYYRRRLQRLGDNLSEREVRRLYLIEQARSRTQTIRNWAYPEQIVRIVSAVFQPLDDKLAAEFGIPGTAGLRIMLSMVEFIEKKLNAHLAKLRLVFRGSTLTSLTRRYYEAFPGMEGSPDELLDVFKAGATTREQAKYIILSHANLRLVDVFTVTLNDFVAALGGAADESAVEGLVDRWSYGFGDLHSEDSEYFFLGNPIWQKPLIKVASGQYFFPNPGLFFSFCLDMMEGLIRDRPDLLISYQSSRAEFLENQVEQLVREAFPGARIYRGTRWKSKDTGETFENDVLVLLDQCALVIEAKSGRMTAPARRGAESRMQHDLRKLVEEPAQQAHRFIDYLRGADTSPERATTPIDVSEIRWFIPLAVTLEHLGSIGTRWPTLREAGFVSEDARSAPVVSLGDLEIICTVLPTVCARFHYLKRRLEFEQHMNYVGDEMDLLGFYLETGFNIGDDEYSQEYLLNISGMSARSIDPYFMRTRDQSGPKPRPRYSKWWNDLLARIEDRRAPGWTRLGTKLLNVAHQDQIKAERAFQKVQKAVRRGFRGSQQINHLILVTGPAQRRDAFMMIAYASRNREDRDQLISDAAGQLMESQSVDEVLVLGVDAHNPHYPYNVVAMLVRSTETASMADESASD